MICASALALCAAPTEAALAAGWSIQATPAPAGAKLSALYGVSCPSPNACTAVGDYMNGSSADVTLAPSWSSTTGWAVEQSPVFAVGVSCASASTCIAVGTQTERWDGVGWTTEPIQEPPTATYGGVLLGVSCASARVCTAVGSFENHRGRQVTLAERWNGAKWSLQPTPNPKGASSGFLKSVSCASPSTCTAVGTFDGGAAELTSGSRPLVERWNGRRWAIERTPRPAGASIVELDGVSCATAATCTAVGTYLDRAGRAVTLAERWNGRRWSIQRTPSRGQVDVLASVSCPSKTVCTAVGHYLNGVSVSRTLAERWSDGRWSIQATPNPAAATFFSDLKSVSCASSSLCTAIGFSDAGGMLAERFS